jgi:hypothetical protein
MRTQPGNQESNAHCYQFCFPELDTLIEVDAREAQVIIRATRDTFSERQKRWFIRELVAEGFIDEGYGWWEEFGIGALPRVLWQVDYSWLEPNQTLAASARRFMLGLFGGITILWLILIGSSMLWHR